VGVTMVKGGRSRGIVTLDTLSIYSDYGLPLKG
jgi:hypothetical protein